MAGHLRAVDDMDDLPVYPFTREDRLESHYFMAWERRRWLNSDMRMKGRPECRALYFDLICISFEQSPIGTLPDDMSLLAKLTHTDLGHFEQLCGAAYGPLHKWRRCRCEDEEGVRLYHPVVLRTLNEAVSRKEDNRARMEAANIQKRLQRLRTTVAGFTPDLAKNDAAIRWMDEWLVAEGCEYRNATWIERAMMSWSNHMLDRRMQR
ncbi:hypothetical protein [Salipiger thiooxidans]|uniref:hypothetical protein n=1 Tax=Salipiger thiooxidans TaxID=282683 RepID=UPI001CD77302|nr:hypothetical protein [Salipiger thiooxidans]MCA0848322.1 hypothetical protein [Salipiger thiooxidans]